MKKILLNIKAYLEIILEYIIWIFKHTILFVVLLVIGYVGLLLKRKGENENDV